MSKPIESSAPEKKETVQHQHKPKGSVTTLGGCHALKCKSPEKRFTFCDEHYEQFKFGLIKKSGEPVSDYEKKFEHYAAYKAKQSARKAA